MKNFKENVSTQDSAHSTTWIDACSLLPTQEKPGFQNRFRILYLHWLNKTSKIFGTVGIKLSLCFNMGHPIWESISRHLTALLLLRGQGWSDSCSDAIMKFLCYVPQCLETNPRETNQKHTAPRKLCRLSFILSHGSHLLNIYHVCVLFIYFSSFSPLWVNKSD